MTTAPLHPVDVFLMLIHGDRVLLALRRNTGYADGQWNLPSGKLEGDEDVLSAVIREAREEVGIRLARQAPRLVATVHHRGGPGHARVGLAFTAAFEPHHHGEPENAEPEKCAQIGWFPIADLPPDTNSYTAACVRAFLDRTPLLLDGWPASGGAGDAASGRVRR
ncbi:NUDIX domain-containing protein [Plantactinospora sp. GCM10030261]|uniref:NUDIX domain-containing protein n=1 Tax=Plantactinospora sp. GCM10030261 TaxID=3273420 RepID=UPI00361F2656